jgi:hypothetical protein
MAGLVPAIHVVRRIELFVSAARAKALCLAELCLRAAPCRPVFEALPAWIAGTSPDHRPGAAMTTRAETNSECYKSLIFLVLNGHRCYKARQ